ncbi:hypothetical protein [Pseudoalteromonas sp. JB197]|uniref:hypothetical protein n=1 Tax=Pseudoalteromonas sp. JB197 TaxID=1434839 RepID=UPI00097EFC4F|nr:hypothetical protein [Pseudoalteromonas sp. JB197]PCC12907.1 hypothetical protein CIK86_06235 [Pseudoalteromonas sp. JB197]SJN25421.1 hypothetical protein CZ797_04230 [Pseudoalteromonas sp. JB197]
MKEISTQINRVEVAAEVTKRASMLQAKTAAVNLGDETLVLLKMMVALCGELKQESQQAIKELGELKKLVELTSD